jgi:sulfite exporter TauE/SafE/copper chaperone CopZ
MKKNQRFSIEGMQCVDCENIIEEAALSLLGVQNAKADFTTESLELDFDPGIINLKTICAAINTAGYTCHSYVQKNSLGLLKHLALMILAIAFFNLLFQFKKTFAIDFSLDDISANASYGLLFLVGVLTSFHCIGMCGGFVLSYSVAAKNSEKSPHLSHISYGLGKIISYTGFGALFGLIGGAITITVMMKSIISGLAGLFLIMYGLSMMDAFAGLRRFHIRLPRFLVHRLFSQQRKSSSPLIIGLLNGLMIACGPLQAMYVLAAGTGSAVEGAKLLAVFAVGTLPLMLLLGYTANMVTANMTRTFLKISGIIILVLGVIMLNRGLLLSGTGNDFNSLSAIYSQKIKAKFMTWQHEFADVGAHIQAGYQVIYMEVEEKRYIPDDFTIRKNVPVKWIINVKQLPDCNKQIVIPSMNKTIDLHLGLQIIEFTPTDTGVISWSCQMGMIPGAFIVSE